eukprot:11060843-Ditylum_brightwellii.AAC.1
MQTMPKQQHNDTHRQPTFNCLCNIVATKPPIAVLPPSRIPPMDLPTPKASTVQLPLVALHHAAPLPREPLAFQPTNYAGPLRVVPRA